MNLNKSWGPTENRTTLTLKEVESRIQMLTNFQLCKPLDWYGGNANEEDEI